MRIRRVARPYYVYGLGLLYEVTETATNRTPAPITTTIVEARWRSRTGAGMPTDRVRYSAYGMMTYRTGTNDTPFLYNGRYGVMTDPNGLLYMQARYYNPIFAASSILTQVALRAD